MTMTKQTTELLALVPTADLIEGLLSRYDDAIFSGIQDRKVGAEKTDAFRVVSRRFCGDLVSCIGQAHGLAHYCQIALEGEIEEMSEEDL